MKHHIVVEGGGEFDVAADEDTLLRGALRAGIGLPHECSVGGCGACRFELVSGELQTLWADAPGLSERDRRRGKHLACQSRPLGDCAIRVRCDETWRPAAPTARHAARLVARRQLSHDMASFTFSTEAPARFRAGQYAVLYPPGVEGARAYSMANLGNAHGLWEFVIRRVPGGAGSNALFEAVGVGDAVPLDGPYGHAWLREDNTRDVVCIAGGSGLAPALGVARGALAQPDGRRVHLFYGARSQADLGAVAPLQELARDPRVSLCVALSAPAETPAWDGPRGFIHDEVERRLAPGLDACEYYFAGPPPMIEAVQTMLMQRHGVPYAQLHFDRFV